MRPVGYDGINGAGFWAEMGNWYDRQMRNNQRSERDLISWRDWAHYPGDITINNATGMAEDDISTSTFDYNRVKRELVPNRVQNTYIKIPALRLWYRTEQEARGGLKALLSAWNTKELLLLNDETGTNGTVANDEATDHAAGGGVTEPEGEGSAKNASARPSYENATSYLQYKLFTLIQAQLNTEDIHSFDGTRGVKPIDNSSFTVTKDRWPLVCKTFQTEGEYE